MLATNASPAAIRQLVERLQARKAIDTRSFAPELAYLRDRYWSVEGPTPAFPHLRLGSHERSAR
jgi:hypothetical protein